jgi:hypothetical protein
MNDFAELAFMETPLIDAAGFMELILRFVLNMVVVVAIIRFLPEEPSSRLLLHIYAYQYQHFSDDIPVGQCETENRVCTWIVCYLRHNSLPDRVDACA